MSSKWTVVSYENGDRSRSVTQVVTASSMEMDKNRCLKFFNGKYDGGTVLILNKDEWISVIAKGASIDNVESHKFGGRSRSPRKRSPSNKKGAPTR